MSEEEEWRPVVGYEGLYEVSDRGQVRSLRAGRILSACGRYPQVELVGAEGQRRKNARLHHLVLEAFVGPRPAGCVGRHLDDDKSHNALVNLAWGTKSQNARDAVRNGRHCRAGKPRCPKNHPYDEANTRAKKGSGYRICVACKRERAARYGARQREQRNA